MVYQKSKRMMASGGFNLRKWNINSQNLLKAIEACENLQVQRRLTNNATADDESYTKSSTTLVIQRYCGQRGRNDLGHCCR